MEDDVLRLHELSIWNLKFKHSKRFQFRNREDYTQFTNQLIVNYEPYVYRRYEDEFNIERLFIKISWNIMVFSIAFLLLIIAFLFLSNHPISYLFLLISILCFVLGVLLKRNYIKFAFQIDVAKELLTDELIEKVKEDLLACKSKEIE